MAASKQKHHSHGQRRAGDGTKRFRSEYTIERLYFAVGAVARDLRPDDPEELGQEEYTDNGARVMAKLGELPPPKANAVYGRINNKLPKKERQSWATIVKTGIAVFDGKTDAQLVVGQAGRDEPTWFQDEGYLVYSLRRVGEHLGLELGGEGPRQTAYDRAYRELLDADRQLRRGEILADLLLSSRQIKVMAADAGWDGACELAGFLPPGQAEVVKGFDPVQMLAHFYETRRTLPRNYEELRQHAAQMNIPLPAEKTVKWTQIRGKFIAARKAIGLETPKDGPLPGQELAPEQVVALLKDAPRMQRKGHWQILDNTVDALAEYIEHYEHKADIRQRHYITVCSQHGWPSASAVTACAKKHGIGAEQGDGPFRAMFELARARARERRRKAA